jgi:hypothetical protein
VTFTIFAAVGLTALELVRNVPAPLKVRRTGSTAGLSSFSMGVLVLVGVMWLVYAMWVGAVAAIVSSFCVAVVLGWWCFEMWKAGANKRKIITGTGVGAIILGAVATVSVLADWGSTGVGVLLVVSGVAFGVPRLVVGLRADSLTGVSGWYLALNLADALIFGMYGWHVGAWGYVGFGVVQLCTSGPVLLRWALSPSLRADTSKALQPPP